MFFVQRAEVRSVKVWELVRWGEQDLPRGEALHASQTALSLSDTSVLATYSIVSPYVQKDWWWLDRRIS